MVLSEEPLNKKSPHLQSAHTGPWHRSITTHNVYVWTQDMYLCTFVIFFLSTNRVKAIPTMLEYNYSEDQQVYFMLISF